MMPMALRAWVTERLAQCERIATTKTDPMDRAGWLEDAAYFQAILRALRTRPDYDLGCQRCQAPHNLDSTVPSEVWNQLVDRRAGKDDDWGLLCTLCIDELAAEKGLTCDVVEFYFVGQAVRCNLYASETTTLVAALAEIAQTIGWSPGEKTLVQAVKDEWHDFMMVINHCSEIYGAASGNRISKPNTLPGEVIREMEDRENADIDEAVREVAEPLEREAAALRVLIERSVTVSEDHDDGTVHYVRYGEYRQDAEGPGTYQPPAELPSIVALEDELDETNSVLVATRLLAAATMDQIVAALGYEGPRGVAPDGENYLAKAIRAPIPMVLHCPACGVQHVDAPEPETGWTNPPHRSHQCHACQIVWRPSDVPTVGVATITTRGSADTWVRDAFKALGGES